MRRIPKKALLQLSLGVSTLLAGEGVSRACSGLQCDPVELGPPAAAALPANVPSFYVRPDRIYHADAGTVEPEAGVHLLNGAGQSLPFDLSPDMQTGGFWVKPKSATAAGTLAVKQTRLANDYVTGPRCHSTDRPSAIVAFAFEPSAALKLFLPVARLTLKVDGSEWATSRVGTTDVPRTIYQSDRSSLEVHTLCRANTGSEFHVRDEGLTAGSHTAELTVTLAGGVQLPPLSVPFSINCGNEGPPEAVDGGGWTAPFAAALLLVRRARRSNRSEG